MRIVANLLGRKKPTTANLSLELEAKKAALADAALRIEAASSARQAAIERQDKAALILADAAKLDAEQDVALATAAITALQAAHTEAAVKEERDAFRQAVEDHRRVAVRLTDRIKSEYPSAAAIIGKLVSDLSSFEQRDTDLRKVGSALGETVDVEHPETFRKTPASWSVMYPNAEGDGVIQGPVADAPWGAVRWENGEPVPAREGVRVWRRPPNPYEPLRSISSLPGLRGNDQPFHSKREEPVPIRTHPDGVQT